MKLRLVIDNENVKIDHKHQFRAPLLVLIANKYKVQEETILEG